MPADSSTTSTDTTTETSPTTISTDIEALAYLASHADLMSYFGSDTAGAIKHYNDFGYGEGREITFDATQYLANNADLADFFSAKKALHDLKRFESVFTDFLDQ